MRTDKKSTKDAEAVNSANALIKIKSKGSVLVSSLGIALAVGAAMVAIIDAASMPDLATPLASSASILNNSSWSARNISRGV